MKAEIVKQILNDKYHVEESGKITIDGQEIIQKNGIPRFTPSDSYSSGNFSRLRDEHAKLQLDSVNGTRDRLDTILLRTNWPPEFFKGKVVLECGCGAGADTEILRSLGATVVSVDIAGVDVAKSNLGDGGEHLIVQASIMDLPFKKRSFDIVWCHRVLQHTPDPRYTLDHILQFVKEDGAVFVHSYSRSFRQMVNWKYALRPLTTRMRSDSLYNLIKWYSPGLYAFTNLLRKVPPPEVGKVLFFLSSVFIPIRNYRFEPKFAEKTDQFMIEYSVHDTFDALSPKYDKPIKIRDMKQLAHKHLRQRFEVVETGVTLLRTVVR